VTAIALDPSGHFFLTGSSDSTVLVWSLLSILAIDDTVQSWQSDETRTPVHNLTSHRALITAICTGHSSSNSNIAISLAEDRTALIWQYTEGVLLKSYLLDELPRCLTIDPADRAFYVGYESGGVQMIQFYDLESENSNLSNVASLTNQAAPYQPKNTNYWLPPGLNQGSEFGATLSLSLSFDGTQVLSGHQNGQIASWDVTQGHFAKELYTLPGPVTNLICLQPKGFVQPQKSGIKIHSICKPKFESNTYSDLTVSAQLVGDLDNSNKFQLPEYSLNAANDFSEALFSENFPDHLIYDAIRDTENSSDLRKSTRHPISGEKGSDDFISLNDTGEGKGNQSSENEIELLKKQIENLQQMQKESFNALNRVRRDRDVLRRRMEEEEEEEEEETEEEDMDGEEMEDA
jgi:pre-rRNA-processing protein IPI3